jgi:uncharacterized protein (DUF305 family)
MQRLSGLMAAVAASALLVGCTSGSAEEPEPAADASADETAAPRVLQPGAPGQPNRELTEDELARLDLTVEHTEADVAFMQGMIPHHVQALRMTRLVPDRTSREDVPLFAERIDVSQVDEIDLMKRWLEERDEDVPSLLAPHDHGDGDAELMPGMLTEEEFEELEAASGEQFDRLFLEAMIRHHLGAITMVQDLYAQDGGQEPEISQFANHVLSDQAIEIDRAERMLAELGP